MFFISNNGIFLIFPSTFVFVVCLLWVVVTHVVSPAHFYVRYVSEQRAGVQLSRKINTLCMGSKCMFNAEHAIRKGEHVGMWAYAPAIREDQYNRLLLSIKAFVSCSVKGNFGDKSTCSPVALGHRALLVERRMDECHINYCRLNL